MCQKFDMLIKLMINFFWAGDRTSTQNISSLFVFPKLIHISRIQDVWIHGKFLDNIPLPQEKANSNVLLLHSLANQ